MSLQWTNEHEIMRDLRKAQGTIPFNTHSIICSQEKPNQRLIEEKETDVTHCCDDIEFKSGPDLKLIKRMLDMVRETNISPTNKSTDIVSVNSESKYEVCKLDPVIVSQKTDSEISIDKVKVPKVKKQRNVALASILEAMSRNTVDSRPDENVNQTSTQKSETQMKLLKPEDFIIKHEPYETIEPVNCIVNILSPNVTNINIRNCYLKTELKPFDSYKPSVMAEMYYMDYLERSKLKSMHPNFIQETEKLLKIVNIKDPEVLCLLQHRHKLKEECIVCKILCKNHA